MKNKLLLITCCVATMLSLSGCFGGGDGSGAGSGGGFNVAGLPGGGDHFGGDSILGGGMDSIPHNPEPATVALLGGGLAAYALLRRKKKK